ncbi:MAG: hypothetical protein WDM71_03895 [Ferruginibacter sp.]
MKHWREFYEPTTDDEQRTTTESYELHKATTDDRRPTSILSTVNYQLSTNNLTQLHNTYIIVPTEKGFMVVHQQNAHERVLYEQFVAAMDGKPIATQRSLFR